SGITVNAVCPGYIATEMVKAVPQDVLEKSILPHIPLGRLGEPEEIARCVVFLASDDAGFITGSTLTAHGGQCLAWGRVSRFRGSRKRISRHKDPMDPSERIDRLIAELTDWRGKRSPASARASARPTGRSSRNGSGWEARCGLAAE